MQTFWSDVRYALRALRRAPTFTVVAVLTLAIGIGANTAIFSVVDGVLLRELPYEEPDELVTVWLDMTRLDGPEREWFTPPDFQDFRSEPGLFAEMAGWGGFRPTLTGFGEPEVINAGAVTQGMFSGVLRVQPLLGRTFLPEENVPGAERVVVVSHSFWTGRLSGNPDALGGSIVLGEVPYTVVGVMPAGFGVPFVPDAELWVLSPLDAANCPRGCFTVRAIARLAPGVTLDGARARASALATRLAEAYPETNDRVGASVFGLKADLVGPAQRALWVLFGTVGFVLLIACVNVANLQLARGAARESELSVRVALGAGRGPIFRQLLTESVVLALIGGGAGVLLALWATDGLMSMVPVALPGLADVGIDPRSLLFSAVITLGTGLVFGLVPAWSNSRPGLYARIRGASGAGNASARVRGGLVVSQVAMAMVLLIGAGLLLRSFQSLNDTDLGFEPDGVLAVGLQLPAERFRGAERLDFYTELLDRLGAIPGVVSVGMTNSPPMAGFDGDADFRVEGEAPPALADRQVAWVRRISGGYFYTMEQELLEGRPFSSGDGPQSPLVIIINETLAERYFDYPRRNPVGSRIGFGGAGEWRTIVGIAEDTRHFGVREDTRPAAYFPYGQAPSNGMTMLLRTDGDPNALAAEARAAVAAVDPALAASRLSPLGALVEGALASERFVTRLLGAFAAIALTLAAVGLYGLISYAVTRRLREMGIRRALGAEEIDVVRMVVGSGLGLTAIGIGVGLVGALLLTRVLDSLLYNVSTTDPVTFVGVAVILAAVAVAASWFPASRARRADPVAILRQE